MFGYGYKEDALKWREHKRQEDEKFKRGYATCKVTVHLIGGDKKAYTEKEYNSIIGCCFLNTDGCRVNGKDSIKTRIYEDAIKFAKDGVMIVNTYYMPQTILRIEYGDIVEFKE